MNTKSLGDSVRKIAKQIMTDNLALQYSWTGRKEGKSALADYPMFITVLQGDQLLMLIKCDNGTHKSVTKGHSSRLSHLIMPLSLEISK